MSTPPAPPPRTLDGFSLSLYAPMVFFFLLFGSLFLGLGMPIGWLIFRVGRLTGPLEFMLAGGAGMVVFGTIGLASLILGVRQWRLMRAVWRDGMPIEATVTDCYRDDTIKMTKTTAVGIEYAYDIDNVSYEGKSQFMDGLPDNLDKGATVWVLVHPKRPDVSLVYPRRGD